MQSQDDIRKALQQLIESIEDLDLLQQLMGDVVPYVIENRRRHPLPENPPEQKTPDDISRSAYKIDPEDPGAQN